MNDYIQRAEIMRYVQLPRECYVKPLRGPKMRGAFEYVVVPREAFNIKTPSLYTHEVKDGQISGNFLDAPCSRFSLWKFCCEVLNSSHAGRQHGNRAEHAH